MGHVEGYLNQQPAGGRAGIDIIDQRQDPPRELLEPIRDRALELTADLDRCRRDRQPARFSRRSTRLTTEVASLRYDVHVLTAIVQRLDNPQGRMLEEFRAMHRQQSRFGERLRQLEEQR
jgi:hypothetical protein